MITVTFQTGQRKSYPSGWSATFSGTWVYIKNKTGGLVAIVNSLPVLSVEKIQVKKATKKEVK